MLAWVPPARRFWFYMIRKLRLRQQKAKKVERLVKFRSFSKKICSNIFKISKDFLYIEVPTRIPAPLHLYRISVDSFWDLVVSGSSERSHQEFMVTAWKHTPPPSREKLENLSDSGYLCWKHYMNEKLTRAQKTVWMHCCVSFCAEV